MANQMEYLDRGIVAISEGAGAVYVGWRLLGTDPSNISFNLYRSTGGGTAVKLNSTVITATTDYVDTGVNTALSNSYFVKPVISGVEQAPSESYTLGANCSAQQYLGVPLQIPAGVTTPDGVTCTYSANDCTVADLDGDGQYEIIVKWDPSNSQDNANSGYTGNVYVDAYKLDGTRLWRIDLGKNIRAGAHYTQIIAYDLDGDGCAEVAMKTAPYTVDGQGNYVLMPGDSLADYRNSSGYILSGPEYLTIFNGRTGAAMVTTNYYPARGTVSSWGDTYGNRCDRYLAAVAYLDGVRPSLIECRGYYGPKSGISTAKNYIVAWNYRNGTLTRVWTFEAAVGQDGNINSSYVGQGDHSLTIADVDGDGKDEIVYGSCVIDDNGTGLYSTGLGHGDAIHVGVFDPTRTGLESWQIHETPNSTDGYELHDAATGAIIWGGGTTTDDGRGCCDNILAGTVGAQMWSAATNYLYDASGNVLGTKPSSDNFLVWWDGDTSRELEDGTSITKYSLSGTTTLLTATGCSSNNGTKSTPCLVADILGDWREEVIWRTTDSSELRIYTTTDPSTTRIYTLMDDLQYRESIAWQNVAYNQPPHTSFYLGYGMSTPPTPNIYVVSSGLVPPAAPAGLAVTVASSSEIDMSWTASSGATSYRVKRSDNSGGTFYTIATGVTGLSYADTTVASGGTYYYVVSAVSSSGGSANSVQAGASIPLISPWVSQDIGSVGVVGRTTYLSGIFTVTGSNANSPDGLQFATQGLINDSTLICKVISQDSSTGSSGLMIRKSSSTTSAYASIVVAADTNKHIFFYYRSSDGGSVKYGYTYYTALPIWLKLVRSGSSFSGYYSTDGTTWTQVGSTQTISMNTLTLGGLAVCSDGTYLSSTTEFSNVSITSANTAPTVSTAAKASPSTVTGTTSTLSVVGTDDGGESNLKYTWATTGTPPAPVTFTVNGSVNGTNAAKNATATFTKSGTYYFQVTIMDSGGLTVTSSVSVTVNQTVTTISVSPSTASIYGGTTQQFTATAYDQFGYVLSTQPTFSWSATAGTITSAGLYTAPMSKTTATVTAASAGKSGTASVSVSLLATIAGRMVFYNNSKFDAVSDDNAIATDKTALLPGQPAAFANYTSYSLGINGIMIDIKNLANPTGLNATDFQFKMGNDDNPDGLGWTLAPAPISITVRQGAGSNGSDRVVIIWDEETGNSIKNKWLQVTVKANTNTGLSAADVFYFGNAVGESDDNSANAVVDGQDEINSRTHKTGFSAAAITNLYDYNRDGKVNATDDLIARHNRTDGAGADPLQLIAAPATASASAEIVEEESMASATMSTVLDESTTAQSVTASMEITEALSADQTETSQADTSQTDTSQTETTDADTTETLLTTVSETVAADSQTAAVSDDSASAVAADSQSTSSAADTVTVQTVSETEDATAALAASATITDVTTSQSETASTATSSSSTLRQMENLDRGVVAVRSTTTQVFISWRLLALDPSNIAFNLYRSANGGAAVKLNSSPLTGGTDYTDTTADLTQSNTYYVRPVIGGVEQDPSESYTLAANAVAEPCVTVPLRIPDSGYTTKYVWVGDLDGDGEYDYVIDRLAPTDPNNSDLGLGPQYIEAYKSDGTFLWSVNLGPNSLNIYNIQPGSSTIDEGMWDGVTVYDLDGDGRAEVIIKSANGVTFGNGAVLSDSNNNHQYISVLDGLTGAERARIQIPTDYIARGQMGAQFAIAYLNGSTPSLVAMMKNRNADKSFNLMICAWDFNGTSLSQRWKWLRGSQDCADGHQMRIADVDGDGKDEICEIGFCLNSDGTLRYSLASQGIEHGDRFYVGKFDPNSSDLQGYGIQQDNVDGILEYYYDASTGVILWEHTTTPPAGDVGRGMVGDIDPNYPGYEVWSFSGLYNGPTNTEISTSTPYPCQTFWWDGDLLTDNLNDGKFEKWNYSSQTVSRMLTTWQYETATESGTNPMFIGDIFGDWRTEVIYTSSDYSKLVIFTTATPSDYRIYTMAQNPEYRDDMTIKGYMESPLVDYYLGYGMSTPPTPNIYTVQFTPNPPPTPTNITATVITPSRIDLTWTASAGATMYRIKRSSSADGIYDTIGFATSGTSFSDTNVEVSGVYYYIVTAINNSGESANSSVIVGSVTGLPAPTNLTVTAISSTQIDLSWTASSGATSYIVRRSFYSGGPYTTMASGITSTSYSDTNVTCGGTYYFVVAAVSATNGSANSAEIVAKITLISPWVAQDIGSVTTAGYSTYSNSQFSVTGAVGGFQFVYEGLIGDCTIVAKLESLSTTTGSGGIMIRNSTASDSRYVEIYATNDSSNHIFFNWQSSDGGSSSYKAGYVAVPLWLKLTRVGNDFSAYYGSDGSTWTQLGSTRTISMNTLTYGGMFAYSSTSNSMDTAVFSNVSITSANTAPTVSTAAKATPSTVTGTTSTLSVLGADDGGESNLKYTWSTTGTPPAPVTFTVNGSVNGTNAAKNATATFTKSGIYYFQVTIMDSGGLTVTSSVTVTVNQTVTTISVSPSTVSLFAGTTQQFTATAYDQFGYVLSTQPTFTWSATSGTITSAGQYTAPESKTTATVTAASSGKSGTALVSVSLLAAIAGRMVFYNNSKFDAVSDDNAIATDKSALLPGQSATFVNYTSYSRGINGIMVDIKNLANPTGLNATDFQFKMGNDDNPDGLGWTLAPAPISVDVRQGQGIGGSDRVTIIWDEETGNSIKNKWLQVTVKANTNTGLSAADVFYFGNAMGESGDNSANAVVDAQDEINSRANKTGFTAAAITDHYDYNRDGKVNATDDLIARHNPSGSTPLQLIAAPVGSPPASGDSLQALSAVADTETSQSASSSAEIETTQSVSLSEDNATSQPAIAAAEMTISQMEILPAAVENANSQLEILPAAAEIAPASAASAPAQAALGNLTLFSRSSVAVQFTIALHPLDTEGNSNLFSTSYNTKESNNWVPTLERGNWRSLPASSQDRLHDAVFAHSAVRFSFNEYDGLPDDSSAPADIETHLSDCLSVRYDKFFTHAIDNVFAAPRHRKD
ncbi:MAG: hypothetical protein ABSA16_13015 [Thermoguttaceae bacterium]